MGVRRSNQLHVFACPNGHAFFIERPECPTCGGPLAGTREPANARLLTHTTVRVNPTGRPFILGLAETRSGARTLCVLDAEHAVSDVELYVDGDRIGARPACAD